MELNFPMLKRAAMLCCFMITLFPLSALAQGECGTEATPEQIRYMAQDREARQSYNPRAVVTLPIQFHVVRTSAGTGGLTTSQLTTIFNTLNTYYDNADVQFSQCGPTNFIDSDTYYNFTQSEETALGNANDVTNVVNIYFFNTVTSSSGSSLCGYTRFPPSVDRIIMKNSCATNGSTIVHEMGHYLSLYHSHGKTNTGTTDELVDGSNCTTKGDNVCDTPADPNLSGKVSSSCLYTGTGTDANGDTYVPNPRNVMSYSRKVCRDFLSPGQYSRVAFSAANDRNYLNCTTGGGGCSSTVSSFPWSEGFESGLGGFTNEGGDNFDWTRRSGSTPSTNTGPTSAQSGSYYIYTESSSPNYPAKVANIQTPCFNFSGQSSISLTFRYHMYGANIGNLRVQASSNDGASWSTRQTISGDMGNSWKTSTVNLGLYAGQSSVRIRFSGTTGTSYRGDIAIDNLSMTTGGGTTSSTSTFESGFDGWTQGSGDDLNWTRRTGSTPSSSTGPASAYQGVYYVYVEASSPNYPSKNTYLISPTQSFASGGSASVNFRYHMYGSTMGSLNLRASSNGGSTWSGILWSQSGDQGNSWKTVAVNLASYAGNSNVKLRFEGITGSSWRSDICLDNIFIGGLAAEPSADQEAEANILMAEPEFKVFPNPSQGQLNLELNGDLQGAISVEFLDATGRIVKRTTIEANQRRSLEVGDLPAGYYFVRARHPEFSTTNRISIIR